MVFENKLQNLEEMKTKLFYLLMAMFFAFGNLKASDRVVVRASEYDISDNLNLEAVASLFGESDNLVDFERKLNNPKKEIVFPKKDINISNKKGQFKNKQKAVLV